MGTPIDTIPASDLSQHVKVVIGLITCRNPSGLAKSLSHLTTQACRFSYRVVVVDNDSGLAGKSIVTRYAAMNKSVTFEYVVEAQPGIPFARNRLVSTFLETDANFLLMYDDDEYPAPGWIEAMVESSLSTGADIVGGGVEAVLENPAVEPIRTSDYHKQGGKKKSRRILVESTANLLVTRRVFEMFKGEWFRRDFADTGGSDTDFLRRTAKVGFRHALAPDALVYEDIPQSRISADWLQKRAYRSGGCIVIARHLNDGLMRTLAFETASIAYLLMIGLTRLVFTHKGTRRRHEAVLMLARGRGKAAALLGHRYKEYSQEHYR